jgi:two-component system KDP operon response regulator KdpE
LDRRGPDLGATPTGARVERPTGSPTPGVPTRVLLVLDQPMVAELVKLTLNHGVYETRHAVSAAEALVLLGHWRPHLVLLDMELEGVDGARVMERIGPAAGGGRIPAIALTRRGDLRTKLEAFERGVDDIMTLPFPPEELLARVVALVRRAYPEAAAFAPVIRLGELEIDIMHRTVRAGAAELHLTALEQSLLYLLAANAGRVVAREEILDALWGPDYVVGSNVVDRQVRNLRAVLRDDWRRPRFIVTVPGKGYRFLPTLRDDGAGPAR